MWPVLCESDIQISLLGFSGFLDFWISFWLIVLPLHYVQYRQFIIYHLFKISEVLKSISMPLLRKSLRLCAFNPFITASSFKASMFEPSVSTLHFIPSWPLLLPLPIVCICPYPFPCSLMRFMASKHSWMQGAYLVPSVQ